MNNFHGKRISLPVILFLIAVILECPSLIKSGYFGEISSKYFLSALAYLLFIVLIRRLIQSDASEYLASAVSILMLGNWSQPLLFYSCGIKTAEDAVREDTFFYAELLVKRTEIFAVIAIASTVAVWFAMAVIEKFNRKQWIPTILCTFVCIGLSGVMFLFSDKESNTSTIGGVQPAIVMMFLLLYCFAAFLGREVSTVQKIIYIFCFAIMMAVLVCKHEMGVPILCYISCLIMYIFFYPIPSHKLLISFITAPAAVLTALMIMFPGLHSDTLQKITSRIFSSKNDHSSTAADNLRYSGLFGSYTFDLHLSEATSDFSVNSSIHFFGFLWATVFLVAFVIGCMKKVNEISKNNGFGLIVNIRSLCFLTFCIIIGYNLIVNLGIAPVVGVQALFCGNSFSIAMLSGLLFGGITYENSLKEFLRTAFNKKNVPL